jgi:hypothetical protein
MRQLSAAVLLLALSGLLIFPASATSESGTLQATVFGWVEGTSSATGTGAMNPSNYFIQFKTLQDYDDLTLYQTFVPTRAGMNYADADVEAHLDAPAGATIGTGHLSVFNNGVDTTIHIQFDSWDIGAATGEHKVILTGFDPAPGNVYSATASGASYTKHYLGIMPSTGPVDIHWSGQHDQAAYTNTYYSADYDFVDNGGYCSLTVDRTNTKYPKPAWVIISSSASTLASEYKASGTTQNLIMTDSPIYLDVGFGALGGNQTKTFYMGSPPGATQNISVNLLEKYSNAALVNQAITVIPISGGSGETKTSLYGETLHFRVVPGASYWFNASRAGYEDYNETYTIPASPGIYNVYMERILTPIANHSYAHFSVVDQTNGGLIPNAEIRLSDGQTKLTNSAGYAWFSVNNSEQINYYISKPSGYWPAYGAMNLTADESILVALQRYTGPTATATMPGWTPVTIPTTGTGVDPVVTLSAQLRQQNVQEGMDVWYTNLPFISQFLFLLFIIGGLGLMAGGTRRN